MVNYPGNGVYPLWILIVMSGWSCFKYVCLCNAVNDPLCPWPMFLPGWQRSASCQVIWRTISGRWETPVPVGPAVRSIMTASEAEMLHTSLTWTTLMCWRSGIWCLSSSTGTIKVFWLWVHIHVDAQTNLIWIPYAESLRQSWSLFLKRALIPEWDWSDLSLFCRTRCQTMIQISLFLTLKLSRRYTHICRTSVLVVVVFSLI